MELVRVSFWAVNVLEKTDYQLLFSKYPYV